ncbi:hypothetical protein ACO2Q8_07975 [Larkinella sp. VNQ87]
MLTTLFPFLRKNRLKKALSEAQKRQFTSLLDATRACNRLFSSGKDYSVIKHQHDDIFWVVRTKYVQVLVEAGHLELNPYKKTPVPRMNS